METNATIPRTSSSSISSISLVNQEICFSEEEAKKPQCYRVPYFDIVSEHKLISSHELNVTSCSSFTFFSQYLEVVILHNLTQVPEMILRRRSATSSF